MEELDSYYKPTNWNYNIPYIPFYKKPKSYEIACMLFENCNLNCKFCFETHLNKKIDLEYIKEIPNILASNFKKEYTKNPTIEKVYLMLWGGEIFYDALKDEVFDTYYIFIDKINNIFKEEFPKVKVIFSWLSNGVFSNKERVRKVVEYSKGIINFSYDPINRFKTKNQLNQMFSSAKYFKALGYGDKISITLTKDSIKAFITMDTKLKQFNDMGYNIDVNYYIANPNWKSLLPSDEEIYSFFNWGLDNKLFNCKVIEKLIEVSLNNKVSHYCDCKYCSQITNGEWSVDCAKCSSVLAPHFFYGKYTDRITEENVNEIKACMGLFKRGCLTCDYYENCQMFCWIAIIFNGFIPTICPYKKLYEKIKNDQNIIKDYLTWKNIK